MSLCKTEVDMSSLTLNIITPWKQGKEFWSLFWCRQQLGVSNEDVDFVLIIELLVCLLILLSCVPPSRWATWTPTANMWIKITYRPISHTAHTRSRKCSAQQEIKFRLPRLRPCSCFRDVANLGYWYINKATVKRCSHTTIYYVPQRNCLEKSDLSESARNDI